MEEKNSDNQNFQELDSILDNLNKKNIDTNKILNNLNINMEEKNSDNQNFQELDTIFNNLTKTSNKKLNKNKLKLLKTRNRLKKKLERKKKILKEKKILIENKVLV